MHVMSLNLLTSRKSPLIQHRTTDESLPSENRNSFACSPSAEMPTSASNLYCNTVTQGHHVGQIFCKDIHEILKYVDDVSGFKNDEIQKEQAFSLSSCQSVDAL